MKIQIDATIYPLAVDIIGEAGQAVIVVAGVVVGIYTGQMDKPHRAGPTIDHENEEEPEEERRQHRALPKPKPGKRPKLDLYLITRDRILDELRKRPDGARISEMAGKLHQYPKEVGVAQKIYQQLAILLAAGQVTRSAINPGHTGKSGAYVYKIAEPSEPADETA